MWKRLNQIEIKLSFANIQYPIIIQERGETYEDLEAKLERWKAGEKGTGVLGEYEGGEVGIWAPIQYVNPGEVED
jgi:hypothetical protein